MIIGCQPNFQFLGDYFTNKPLTLMNALHGPHSKVHHSRSSSICYDDCCLYCVSAWFHTLCSTFHLRFCLLDLFTWCLFLAFESPFNLMIFDLDSPSSSKLPGFITLWFQQLRNPWHSHRLATSRDQPQTLVLYYKHPFIHLFNRFYLLPTMYKALQKFLGI